MKIGLVQFDVKEDKRQNVERISEYIRDCVSDGSDVVVLPEMFNSIYSAEQMKLNAESIDGYTITTMRNLAKELKVNIIAGSIPLIEDSYIFNASVVIDRIGKIVEVYKKRHIFTVNIPGKARSDEGSVIKPGHKPIFFELEGFKCSLIICYDIRFFDVYREFDKEDVEVMFMPGAFNNYTGPAHWEVLARSRSIDYQMYSVLVSPASTYEGRFKIHGHSLVVDPFGTVIDDLGEKEGYRVVEISKERVNNIRRKLRYRLDRKVLAD